ncbi:MAG: cardiolipin synthase [Myxococcales bacterium]|nr:cardiolipin synthase [Myxococcales bacterium]
MTVDEALWIVVPAAQALWVAYIAIYILLERRSPAGTLAWIFLLAFLPLIGLIIYFFLGPRRFQRRQRKFFAARARVRARNEEEAARATLREARALPLVQLAETAAGVPARPRAGDLDLYLDGATAYAAMEEAIAAATHHVHLAFYIWDPDHSGTRFRDALVERARAGVEVRVLLDGLGAKATGRFWRPLLDAGGRVERFNPLRISSFRPRLVNFRSHRKIVVIDGAIGFTGGMNVADCHTSERSGDEAWRDTMARVRGPAVRGLQMVFLADWDFAAEERVGGAAYFRASAPSDEPSTVQIVASGPDENFDAIHKLYVGAIAAARERVCLTTPYFVPDEALLQALQIASFRGADVRVLVPKTGDIPLVAAAARSYYPELLQTGVRIFEYGPPVLHAKTLVVDEVLAVVGTANADPRSFRLNFEVVLAAWDARPCRALRSAFEADLARAEEVTLETVAGYGLGRRIVSAGARLFSPVL